MREQVEPADQARHRPARPVPARRRRRRRSSTSRSTWPPPRAALVREFRGLAAGHGSRIRWCGRRRRCRTRIGDEQRVQQIGRALLDNAIRHNPDGTQVRVAVAADDGVVRLEVSDDGPGHRAEARRPPVRALLPRRGQQRARAAASAWRSHASWPSGWTAGWSWSRADGRHPVRAQPAVGVEAHDLAYGDAIRPVRRSCGLRRRRGRRRSRRSRSRLPAAPSTAPPRWCRARCHGFAQPVTVDGDRPAFDPGAIYRSRIDGVVTIASVFPDSEAGRQRLRGQQRRADPDQRPRGHQLGRGRRAADRT